ncbi:MAG: Phosphoribosylpyrophosphate synthetase PrsA [Candidatus Methanohalarchaeum thermophilum]|uniref:Ribose-phosphate pyrophosphokinase n=1 Tax=Methanohalarchaeum thermophilum TaxID=1903181 RepID=A0A1Q6DTD4_METT1|nr:MAG: Phosphoribosylpyrophosphate synthetase PrsA [Candidatus Methanohalarchaeum thermophilum]
MKLVCGKASQYLGPMIAGELGLELVETEFKVFPDGEQYLRLGEEVDESCIVVQTIFSDSDFFNLLLILDALEGNAEKLVVPYFGYARQDKKFNEGEAVSARVIANAVDRYISEVVTIDVHDEGISRFFNSDFVNLTAFREISREIDLTDPLVIAPDGGAEELASTVAEELGTDYDYLVKDRKSETEVSIQPKKLEVKGRDVVLVDDIVSTGGTMSEAISMLKDQGAGKIDVAVTHSVFARNALSRLYFNGANKVISTNTIEKSISSVDVSPVVAEYLKDG